jgi:thiol-disulfide isomerase/thioredoxin
MSNTVLIKPWGLALLVFLACHEHPKTAHGVDEPDSLARLRADIDESLPDGIDNSRFAQLAGRAVDLAEKASDPTETLSILRQAARICWNGPAAPAAGLRSWSLRRLVALSAESSRARNMLDSQFFPALHRIPPQRHLDEVRVFDELVRELANGEVDRGTRARLEYLRPRLRVEVNRAWDAAWLNKVERERSVEWLRKLDREYGDVPTDDGQPFSALIAEDIRELTQLSFGMLTPEFPVTDLQDVTFDLTRYRGKVVVLTFWSSWCAPCLALVPQEQALKDEFANEPFELLGVSCDENAEEARKTSRQHNASWRHILDVPTGDSSLRHYFAIRGLPSAIVIDAEGRICGKFVGSVFNPNFSIGQIRDCVSFALARETRRGAMTGGIAGIPQDKPASNERPGPEGAADDKPLTGDELVRYTLVGQKLVKAINSEDREAYRALFTDEAWESAIPWWREMFSSQISSFGRIETAFSPRRGTVRIGEKMSYSAESENGATLMVRFEEQAGGALTFELNADNLIISSNVYISREMAQYNDSSAAPIFQLK